MSEISAAIRTNFRATDAIRNHGKSTPERILRFDDIIYGTNPEWQVLDIYRPKSEGFPKLPVIISHHGGGWVYGRKEDYQFYCMELAKQGFAVVNFTYRLAPENKFPASLEDTDLVWKWVWKHADEYGFDLQHVYGIGDSAGAHLLGMYATICTCPVYATKFSFQVPPEIVPAALVMNCGSYVIRFDENTDELVQVLMADYLEHGGDDEELDLLNFGEYLNEKFPLTFLMTGTGDFLANQPVYLSEKFMENQVPFVFRYYGDATLNLGHVFHLNVNDEYAKLCNEEETDFLKKLK